MKNRTRWGEGKNVKETKEAHAARIARRRQLAELRERAITERHGEREFTVVRIPATWERANNLASGDAA
jgi:hypothetical protein